jgi:BirA family biotin operon repressor/biotin-[acetyl-CoA-carboxylase] ligase
MIKHPDGPDLSLDTYVGLLKQNVKMTGMPENIDLIGDTPDNPPDNPPGSPLGSPLSNPPGHSQHVPSPEELAATLALSLKGFANVSWLQSTGSTNTDLIELLKTWSSDFDACPPGDLPRLLGAHIQTAGKGRAGRSWIGTPGGTLMFSCAFSVQIPLSRLAGLSPALGVASCEALRQVLPTQAQRLTVKWPNDIQWDQRKLAGLLLESAGKGPDAGSSYLVIGMGLNLAAGQALSLQLGRDVADWASICFEAGGASLNDPAILVSALATSWADTLSEYALTGFDGYVARFAAMDALAGCAVTLSDQGRIFQTGIAQGLDTTGRLLLRTETGLLPVSVGDVSVRRTSSTGK